MLKSLLTFLIFSFATNSTIAFSADKSEPCRLVLGWGEWPPYQSSINPSYPYGLQINLVKQVADAANCSLIFKKNSFEGNLQAVKNGEVDFIMDTSITKERKEFGYFTNPYRQEVLALYLKPKFSSECSNTSFESLIQSGIRIGMNRGNIYGKEIAILQSNPELNDKLVYAPNHKSLYQLFDEGKIDGFFDDPMVLAFKLRMSDKSGELTLCKVSQNSSSVSFLFSKKSSSIEMVNRFNEALEEVKETKEYKENWGW